MAEPTVAQRKMFAKMGIAMPDGSYYIRNESDLVSAIKAVGEGNADHDDIRRFIIKRAAAINKSKLIPDSWNPNGSLKQSAIEMGQEWLAHFGRKGMKWGVRNDGSAGTSHVSEDAARAHDLKARVKAHGTSSLSNDELQKLVTRLNLESQHGRLNPAHVSAGRTFTNTLLKISADSGKQLASDFVRQHQKDVVDKVIKKLSESK